MTVISEKAFVKLIGLQTKYKSGKAVITKVEPCTRVDKEVVI